MRLKNLTKVYIYRSKKILKNGEYTTNWYFKKEEWINIQQDLNELDRNSAGEIDYEKLKLRTDREINLNKGDGVSFKPLKTDMFCKVIKDFPNYLVESNPRIGKTTLYTLITNNGE